jgi:hypothetical protein
MPLHDRLCTAECLYLAMPSPYDRDRPPAIACPHCAAPPGVACYVTTRARRRHGDIWGMPIQHRLTGQSRFHASRLEAVA